MVFGLPETVTLPVLGAVALWMIVAAAAVLFLTGWLRKYGLKKKKDLGTGLAVVAAVLLLSVPGTMSLDDGGQDEPIVVTDCGLVTPDIDPNGYNKYAPSTAITADSAWRYVGNTAWTTSAAGTELTGLAGGQTVEYIVGTDAADDHTGEDFCPYITWKVACVEDTVYDMECVLDEDATGLGSTFFNDNDAAATAQAITTSESKTMSIKYIAGADEVYGNPYTPGGMPNVFVLQINNTDFNAPTNVYVSEGAGAGTTLPIVGCPTLVNGSAAFNNFCFKAPAITEQAMKISFTLNAKAVDPSMDGGAYLLGGGVYIDRLTSQVAYGVEDEAGNAVGVGALSASEYTLIDLS